MIVGSISFPEYSGVRCLMMPFIQGDPGSVPREYKSYDDVIESLAIETGRIGYLTIDESFVEAGSPQRGYRARHGRAIHTEAGLISDRVYCWGGRVNVRLDRDVQILIANSVDDSCAIWDTEHRETSEDGDIGFASASYPYCDTELVKSGDVHRLGVLTPHESLPVTSSTRRQFVRVVGSGVHGREDYFTPNHLVRT